MRSADSRDVDARVSRWDRAKVAPWAVALVISGVIILPQFLLENHKGSTAFLAAFGVAYWLLLAAIFRLVVFLADRFRRR